MTDQNKENPLHISWLDSMWVPHLNSTNVMNYFSERSNPFYSRDCNNEFIKMQQNTRVDQLTHMQGVEYILLHTQEPILYIVRKQHRYSPTQVTPLANYHIIGGHVFQTPDLGSIINSRMLAAVSNLNSAFTELQMYSQYHPSKGYWWQFRNHPDSATASAAAKDKEKKQKQATSAGRDEPASVFQHRRVGALLEDLQAKFPYKYPTQTAQQQQQQQTQQTTQQGTQQQGQQEGIKLEDMKNEIKTEVKLEVKAEVKGDPSPQPASQRSARPPPEKRQRTGP